MTDLVTYAAIDAAENAYSDGWNLHTSDKILGVIEAAAPFIATAALRQAAETLDSFPKDFRHNEYVRGIAGAIVYLSGRADELEGK